MITPVYPIETYKMENGRGYIEYEDTTGKGHPYPSDNLRFFMNGFGTAVDNADTDVQIDLGTSYGTGAYLWTTLSDSYSGLGVFYYEGLAASGDNMRKEPITYIGVGPVRT